VLAAVLQGNPLVAHVPPRHRRQKEQRTEDPGPDRRTPYPAELNAGS
jgi:hypothetical protein